MPFKIPTKSHIMTCLDDTIPRMGLLRDLFIFLKQKDLMVRTPFSMVRSAH